jgi:uncharacterized protein involved in cysteine biosynthesis
MKTPSGVAEWGQSALKYIQDKWADLVIPAAVMGGYQIAMIMGVFFSYFLFAFSFILAEKSKWAPVAGISTSLVIVLVLVELGQPLQIGLYRAIFKSMRGEKPTAGDVLGGFRSAGSAFVMMFLTFLAVITGSLFCYVPGLIVAFFLSFSHASLADRDRGALDAMGASYDLVMSNPAQVALWYLCRFILLFVVAMVPMIGTFLTMPLWAILEITAYLYLQREQAEDLAPGRAT